MLLRYSIMCNLFLLLQSTRNDMGIFNKMRNETNSFVAMRIKRNLFIDRREENEEEENYKVGFFSCDLFEIIIMSLLLRHTLRDVLKDLKRNWWEFLFFLDWRILRRFWREVVAVVKKIEICNSLNWLFTNSFGICLIGFSAELVS